MYYGLSHLYPCKIMVIQSGVFLLKKIAKNFVKIVVHTWLYSDENSTAVDHIQDKCFTALPVVAESLQVFVMSNLRAAFLFVRLSVLSYFDLVLF